VALSAQHLTDVREHQPRGISLQQIEQVLTPHDGFAFLAATRVPWAGRRD
jgi:sulfide:quinone oxidoreductase